MSKHTQYAWPNWKIIAMAVFCAAIGTALFVAYRYVPAAPATATRPAPGRAPSDNPPDPGQAVYGLGLGNMVVLLGLVSWGAALTFTGWLGYRMYMRIPAWRRRRMFGRSR